MAATINKTRKSRIVLKSTSKETKKLISDEDIRRRAFEIYQENDSPSSNEMDNWYYAERELRGYYL